VRRLLLFLATTVLSGESLPWRDLPPSLRPLLEAGGLRETAYPDWTTRHRARTADRLRDGSAEHIAYFLLQSRSFTAAPILNPALAARAYFDSLPPTGRKALLNGDDPGAPFPEAVERRLRSFFAAEPTNARHRILRQMATALDWPPRRIVLTAFRFLTRIQAHTDPDALYQQRGLSADPYAPSLRAVERGLAWLRVHRPGPRSTVLLAGPGAELGSRFGVDDAAPVASPQATALLSLLPAKPARYDCADIRPEVVDTLAAGPCRPLTADLAADRLPPGAYSLAIATNVLVYLDDTELALALANLAQSLAPGGCLIHNDPRFAARLFGEAAGLPALHFESVKTGHAGGRDQLDRAVIHCKP